MWAHLHIGYRKAVPAMHEHENHDWSYPMHGRSLNFKSSSVGLTRGKKWQGRISGYWAGLGRHYILKGLTWVSPYRALPLWWRKRLHDSLVIRSGTVMLVGSRGYISGLGVIESSSWPVFLKKNALYWAEKTWPIMKMGPQLAHHVPLVFSFHHWGWRRVWKRREESWLRFTWTIKPCQLSLFLLLRENDEVKQPT